MVAAPQPWLRAEQEEKTGEVDVHHERIQEDDVHHDGDISGGFLGNIQNPGQKKNETYHLGH